jgi:aldehyde:ferredoxin oxidoreductase
MVIDFQNYVSIHNPLGLCKFMIKGGFHPGHAVDILNAATGWGWTADDLVRTGERIFNLKRLINQRFGVTGADDTLPKRFLTEPRPSGTAKGVLPDLEAMLPMYYERRGWDEDGQPTQERLDGLGVSI